jgi:hypothetical protein
MIDIFNTYIFCSTLISKNLHMCDVPIRAETHSLKLLLNICQSLNAQQEIQILNGI